MIGIRLDKDTEARLESLSTSMNLKKSQLFRRAFNEWTRRRERILGQNMMLCDSLLVASLFELLEDDEINKIADIMSDHITSKIRIRQIERNLVNQSLPEFLRTFTDLTSTQHFGWFNTINFSYEPDEKITIYGFHLLNTQYSKYAVQLFSRILAKTHGYESDGATQNVTENAFILELKPTR